MQHPSIASFLALHLARTAATRLIRLAGVFALLSALALAQAPAEKSAPATTSTRPCAATAADATPSKTPKHSTRDQTKESLDASPACLEVNGEPLELQEALQTIVREQKWRIGQGQVSEDSWSFVRYLDAEELQRFAKADILGGQITWTEGKAVVQVRTSDTGDGFTRVRISAKFQGKGETRENFARPTNLWPLASRGALEIGMIAALEGRFRPQR